MPVGIYPPAGVQWVRKQFGRKDTGGLGGCEVEHKPAMCPCSKEGQNHPGLHDGEHCQSSWGRWSFPSTQLWWDKSRVLNWASLYNRDMDILDQVQQKAAKTMMRLRLVWREAERAETVQPGEEKAQGDLPNVYKYLTGWSKDGPRLLGVFSDRARCNGHKRK